jgi:hypothetical protein
MGPDEDYYGDDLTSHGHGELQQHRELREYARLIAWELPLLSRTFTHISECISCGMRILTHIRSRPTIRTPNSSYTLPLPVHIIPWRIAPSRQQSRRRILAQRPLHHTLSNRRTSLQTNQARGPTLQPFHHHH